MCGWPLKASNFWAFHLCRLALWLKMWQEMFVRVPCLAFGEMWPSDFVRDVFVCLRFCERWLVLVPCLGLKIWALDSFFCERCFVQLTIQYCGAIFKTGMSLCVVANKSFQLLSFSFVLPFVLPCLRLKMWEIFCASWFGFCGRCLFMWAFDYVRDDCAIALLLGWNVRLLFFCERFLVLLTIQSCVP